MSPMQSSHIDERPMQIYHTAEFDKNSVTLDKFPVTEVKYLGFICLSWSEQLKEEYAAALNFVNVCLIFATEIIFSLTHVRGIAEKRRWQSSATCHDLISRNPFRADKDIWG